MHRGYIKLWRKIQDNLFSKDLEMLGMWVKMLLLANHKQSKILIGKQIVILKPGQFATSRKSLSKVFRVSEMKTERLLSLLKTEHQIEQQSFSKFRIISIVNWDKYQVGEHETIHEMNSKRTANEHEMNTNNNDKNVKNVKERKQDSVSGGNGFDIFWAEYPPRGNPPRRMNRGNAMKTWNALHKSKELPPIDEVLRALSIEMQSKQWQNPQYIPMATTWLNRKPWNDRDDVAGSSTGSILDNINMEDLEIVYAE